MRSVFKALRLKCFWLGWYIIYFGALGLCTMGLIELISLEEHKCFLSVTMTYYQFLKNSSNSNSGWKSSGQNSGILRRNSYKSVSRSRSYYIKQTITNICLLENKYLWPIPLEAPTVPWLWAWSLPTYARERSWAEFG